MFHLSDSRNVVHSAGAMENKTLSAWKRVLEDPTTQNYLLKSIDPSTLLIYMHEMPDTWLTKIRSIQSCYGKSRATKELLKLLPLLGDNWPDYLCTALEACNERMLVDFLRDAFKNKSAQLPN